MKINPANSWSTGASPAESHACELHRSFRITRRCKLHESEHSGTFIVFPTSFNKLFLHVSDCFGDRFLDSSFKHWHRRWPKFFSEQILVLPSWWCPLSRAIRNLDFSSKISRFVRMKSDNLRSLVLSWKYLRHLSRRWLGLSTRTGRRQKQDEQMLHQLLYFPSKGFRIRDEVTSYHN